MQSLNFDDGLKRLAINGDENRVIVANTTDIEIIARYKKKLPKIEKLSAETENSEEIPDILDKKVHEFADYKSVRRFRKRFSARRIVSAWRVVRRFLKIF